MLTKCTICGDEFNIFPSRIGKIKSCNKKLCRKKSHQRGCEITGKKLNKKIKKNCIYCGKQFEIQRYRKDKAKYCGLICKNKFEKPRYIDGRASYRKYLKKCCEKCNSTKKRLEIHHKDENRKNNNINNLITLCSKCHKKYHTETLFKKGHAKWSHQ